MAAGVCDSFCSFFETLVTSMFISSSRLLPARSELLETLWLWSSPCANCWLCATCAGWACAARMRTPVRRTQQQASAFLIGTEKPLERLGISSSLFPHSGGTCRLLSRAPSPRHSLHRAHRSEEHTSELQ